MSSFTELHCHFCYLIKDLATASLPEYVATRSHQTDYHAPLRTRQECSYEIKLGFCFQREKDFAEAMLFEVSVCMFVCLCVGEEVGLVLGGYLCVCGEYVCVCLRCLCVLCVQVCVCACVCECVYLCLSEHILPGGHVTAAGHLWDASPFGCVSFVVGCFPDFFFIVVNSWLQVLAWLGIF